MDSTFFHILTSLNLSSMTSLISLVNTIKTHSPKYWKSSPMPIRPASSIKTTIFFTKIRSPVAMILSIMIARMSKGRSVPVHLRS